MLQTSLPYTLSLPHGSTRVVGPDSSEPDFIAHLTRITSDVTWSTSDSSVVAGDGALLGDMYRGMRSVVLDLLLAEHDPVERALKIEWLQRINGLLRNTEGLTLSWTEATGWRKEITGLRPASYIAVSDSWPKELQISLKTSNPFILSSDVHSIELEPGDTSNAFNAGNAPTYPKFFVYGPCSTFLIRNEDTNEIITSGASIPDGNWVEIDTRKRTVKNNSSVNAYGNINYLSTTFFSLAPLDGEIPLTFTATGTGGNTKLIVRWQSAWE